MSRRKGALEFQGGAGVVGRNAGVEQRNLRDLEQVEVRPTNAHASRLSCGKGPESHTLHALII